MFFDVRYRYKKKGDPDAKVQEKSVRVEGKDGSPASLRELVLLCYRTYARRDVEIVEIHAAMYLPKLLKIGSSEDGLITINGKPFDVDQEISEREIPGLPPMQSVIADVPAAPQHQVQHAASPQVNAPQAVAHQTPAPAIQAPRAPDEREEMIFSGVDLAKLDADEKRWKPSVKDRQLGIGMVATYNPARLMRFEPPGSPEAFAHFPLSKGEEVYVSERVWRGRNTFYACDTKDGNSVMIPEELMMAASQARIDPMLDIQDRRPDRGNFVDVDREGKEVVGHAVPLQRSDDLRSSAPGNLPRGSGVVRPDGTVDIDQLELRRR